MSEKPPIDVHSKPQDEFSVQDVDEYAGEQVSAEAKTDHQEREITSKGKNALRSRASKALKLKPRSPQPSRPTSADSRKEEIDDTEQPGTKSRQVAFGARSAVEMQDADETQAVDRSKRRPQTIGVAEAVRNKKAITVKNTRVLRKEQTTQAVATKNRDAQARATQTKQQINTLVKLNSMHKDRKSRHDKTLHDSDSKQWKREEKDQSELDRNATEFLSLAELLAQGSETPSD